MIKTMKKTNEDNIKGAFLKIKEDILFLNDEILNLKMSINELKILLNDIKNINIKTSTIPQKNQTNPVSSTHSSTLRQEIKGFKEQNLDISIGNEGVSTDRQTDT